MPIPIFRTVQVVTERCEVICERALGCASLYPPARIERADSGPLASTRRNFHPVQPQSAPPDRLMYDVDKAHRIQGSGSAPGDGWGITSRRNLTFESIGDDFVWPVQDQPFAGVRKPSR